MTEEQVADRGEIRFPPFRLDLANERLERDGEAVALRPKAMALLGYLARRPGELVRKGELLGAVWKGTYVSDTVVKVCVREVRQALGDDPRSPRYVETVARRGYRFVAPLAASPAGAAEELAGGPGVPVVGRGEDLRELEGCLAAARNGRRQLAFITGAPGIGKTTLVCAFLDRLARDLDVDAATGQCLEFYGSGEAYMPVLEMLDRLCRGRDGAEVVGLLRRQAPSWLVQLPWHVGEAEHEGLGRRTLGLSPARMLREMVELLETLSQRRLLVLVLEDLHWSDGSTLDLLSALIRRPEPCRLLILGTFRTTELDAERHPLASLWHDLRLHGLCRELALNCLGEEEVAEILRRRLPDVDRLAALAALVHRRTDGHPLFVVHLADFVAERLASGGRAALAALVEGGELAVPEDLRQLVDGLIERRRPEEQRLLEAASAAGVQFSSATAGAGLGVDAVAAERVATELARRGQFLRSAGTATWPDGTVVDRYEFVHSLYRSVLYLRLGEAARVRVHRRIGARLEEGFGERTGEIAGELAMHFELGRDGARAVKYREQAAQTAIRRSAYREAIGHAQHGLELLAALPPSRQRDHRELGLRTALGPALMTTRGFTAPEVLANYSRAHRLCTTVGETPEVFPVMWGRWMYHWMRAEHQKAYEIGRACLEMAEARDQAALKTLAHRMLGGSLFNVGELPRARRHLETSLELYDPQRDGGLMLRYASDSAVFCGGFRSHVLWLQGFPDCAREACRAAWELASELEHPFSQAFASGLAGTVALLRGDWKAARECLEATDRVSRTQGYPLFLAAADVRRGALMVALGDMAGFDVLRRGIDVWSTAGAVQWRSLNLLFLADAACRARRPETGLAAADAALELVAGNGERWCLAEILRLKGELLVQGGGADAAAQAELCLRQALTVARGQGARSWELRAATSLLRLARRVGGKHGGAKDARALASVYGTFTEGFETADLRAARELLAAA
jgi:DNA-binding winged helix-turn-helix (wHTH) protein/predicted ATPase